MLKSLVLENFKAVGQRQVIPCAPITLLFGANSSGKSSVLQSMLLLRQSLESEPVDQLLSPNGDWTRLGSFREFVFSHDVGRTVEISVVTDGETRPAQAGPRRIGYQRVQGDRGMGVRARYNENTERIVSQSLPVYIGNVANPFAEWRGVTRHGTMRDEMIGSPARQSMWPLVALGGMQARHEATTEMFEAFNTSILPEIRRITELLIDYYSSGASALESMPPTVAEGILRLAAELNIWAGATRIEPAEIVDQSETVTVVDSAAMIEFLSNRSDQLGSYSLSMFVDDLEAMNGDPVSRVAFLPLSPGPAFPALRTRRRRFRSLEEIDRGQFVSLLTAHHRMVRRLPETEHPRPAGLVPHAALDYALGIADEVRQLLEAIVYVGPLREYPERHYVFTGNAAVDVGRTGGRLPDALFPNDSLVNEVNEVFSEFGIPYRIVVRKYLDAETMLPVDEVFSISLVDAVTSIQTSLVDVGFGISQVLPVIAQSLLARHKLILIEQPELHLHPRLQAELGNLFVQASRSENGNQFLIETHSEHLVLRLQRLVRRNVIPADHVSVIYVSRDTHGSICHQLRLDERGEFIDPWPDGFFDEAYHEMFAP